MHTPTQIINKRVDVSPPPIHRKQTRSVTRLMASAVIIGSLIMASCSRIPVPDSARTALATANAIVSAVTNEGTPTPKPVIPTAPAAQGQTSQPAQPATRIQNPEPTLAPIPTAIPAQQRQNYDEEERVLINLYERANPAVVYIEVGRGSSGGSGSGFVVDKRGYIVTNNHVVEQATQVDVIFSDGTRTPAKIVGRDTYADLAVIKVTVSENRLMPIEFADSSQVKPGQKVIALGNPFGLQGTMTTGIVSAVGRALPEKGETTTGEGGLFSNPDIIQTDAAINPGNSGGPLLDSRGRLIGVNTAIRTSNTVNGQASSSGVGFAVPSNTVKRVYPVLIEEGRYRYPYLGINMRQVDDTIADQFQLPVRRGVLVSDLVAGGPAEKSGLRGIRTQGTGTARTIAELGDIIVALNGAQVKDSNDLISRLSATTRPGDTVTLIIIREGKQTEIKVKLGERPR